jgi:predicted amidohydrolase YtcJ
MKAMGVGWLMQNAFFFRGEAFLGPSAGWKRRGSRRRSPSALRMGLKVGGGTDAHRVMWPSPLSRCSGCWTARRLAACRRAVRRKRRRIEALRLYSEGSA